MAGKRPVFVREATGLVREFGTTEHFITNLDGVVPIFAPAFTAWFIWYAIPGGSVTAAAIGSFLFGAFGYLTAFALISATFPRSGAPYVAQSRILAPYIGWPAEAMMWMSIISFSAVIPSGYVIQWGLAPGLYIIGVLTNSQAAISTALWCTTSTGVLIVGTIFMIVALIPAILGTRILIRTFQIPLFVIATLGLLVTIGVLTGSNNAQFVASFNQLESNLKYNDLVSIGQQLNPQAFAPESLALMTFLAALGMTGGSTNSYWNAWAVGEMKNARNCRNQVISMVVPGLILMLSIIIIVQLEQNIVGTEQLIALTQIGTFAAAQLSNPLFVGGVVTISVPYVLSSNPWIVAFIMISMIAAALTFMPMNWLIISRLPFAWSFDRLIPAKFGEVSERFHTPVFTLVVGFILVEAWLILAATTGMLGLIFSITWAWSAVSVGLTCLACALLPLRKSYWDQSPARWKIFGIPVVTIVGLVGFFYQMDVVASFTLIPALGFGNPQAVLIISSYVIVFVLYWIVKYIRRSQGIDIDYVFRTIPPE